MRLLACLLWTLAAARSETTVADLLEEKLRRRLAEFDASLDGVFGAAVIDLATGHTFGYRGDIVFPQASVIKVPVMIEVFKAARAGRLSLHDSVAVTAADLVEESPQVEAAVRSSGRMTVRELVVAMIEVSDNAATNKLIEKLSMAAVNRTLDELGLLSTRLRRRMIDLAAARRNEENVSTPLEMARLMTMLYRGEVVDKAASAEMLSILKRVHADIRAVVPPVVEVAAKPGELDGVRCEAGVVFLPGRPFAVSINTAYLGARNPVAEITRILYQHFEKLAASNRYGRRVQ